MGLVSAVNKLSVCEFNLVVYTVDHMFYKHRIDVHTFIEAIHVLGHVRTVLFIDYFPLFLNFNSTTLLKCNL